MSLEIHCAINPYTSEITLVDLLGFQETKRYSIVSKNMLNMEKAQEENSGMDIGYVDAAYSYYLHDGKIISYLSLNESGAILEIDTKTDEFILNRKRTKLNSSNSETSRMHTCD